ncbi:hypothetical protein FSARC_5355 [Fusarium sarcochroum]|uniref:Uncharacterized protein n=1 Tax=Fusarium sarcochroum TaxID=1208366 RepID=A0A8H4TZS7_9HYPO|nr:hypothetical protein FSARC_5355 [Fusarium sarcochroum]
MPKRVIGAGWKVKPIADPTSVKWNIRVPGPDMMNLINGFTPPDMDYKWMCRTQGPDEQGNIVVQMCRSWSSQEIVALKGRVFVQGSNIEDKDIEKEGGEILEIFWDAIRTYGEEEPWSEQDAKDLAIGLAKNLLKCNLDP